MAQYRYYLCDLMSNKLIQELPLESVTFSNRLSGTGHMSAYFGLDRTGFDNEAVLEATTPVKTAIYIERDGKLVWGGILWFRMWQEQAKSLQFNASTFDSYFERTDIPETLSYVDTDQKAILIDLIRRMQTVPERNMRIELPQSLISGSQIRTIKFNSYDFWTMSKAVEKLLEFDNPMDFMIDVRYDDDHNFERYLNIADRLGATEQDTRIVFNYPGSIKNFWFPESGTKGATTVRGIGSGSGSSTIQAKATRDVFHQLGYPEVLQFHNDKSIRNKIDMQSKVDQELYRLGMPTVSPTFEINPNMEPEFGSYELGDFIRLHIESAMFPGGKTFTSRIIGWDVTPTRGDSQEQVSLTLEGADDSYV